MTGNQVGFLGLGQIGRPLAEVLQSRGVRLVVYDRTPSHARSLAREGAEIAATPREVGETIGSGIAFLCLSDYPASRAVTSGPTGLLRGMSRGGIVVNLSTIAPEEARRLAADAASQGVRYVDSPIGGSIDAAARGEVLFYVGADQRVLDAVRKHLGWMSREIIHLGPVGSGSAMKLVNNFLTIATVAMDAEALALAEGLGLDLERSVEVLLKGGGRSQMLLNKKDLMLQRDYQPRFRLALSLKDLRLVESMARESDRSVTIASAARKLMEGAMRQGFGEKDFSAVFEFVRRNDRRVSRKRSGRPSSRDS